MHKSDHYTVMEINVAAKKVLIYDGLDLELLSWVEHVINWMQQLMMVGLHVICGPKADTPTMQLHADIRKQP